MDVSVFKVEKGASNDVEESVARKRVKDVRK